jgi:hypothetical protein
MANARQRRNATSKPQSRQRPPQRRKRRSPAGQAPVRSPHVKPRHGVRLRQIGRNLSRRARAHVYEIDIVSPAHPLINCDLATAHRAAAVEEHRRFIASHGANSSKISNMNSYAHNLGRDRGAGHKKLGALEGTAFRKD